MLGTNDLPRATAFYDALLTPLGATRLYETERAVAWGTAAPELAVCTPYDGQPASAGNGTMVALIVPTRALVTDLYKTALSLGGTDAGPPGVRGDNPDGWYAAYVRDLDGNKICLYRMGPAEA